MEHPVLPRMVEALRPVRNLAAIVLGGSRGRGTAGPASDYDIGLYYEPDAPLDVAALQAAIAPLVDEPSSTVTRIGEWGPWINGGGWLTIAGVEVDLLYRDLGRVREVIADARQGRFSMNYQPGHPHGFCSVIWMGEVATCRPLLDPSGRIAELKGETSPFPQALRDALIARFGWEVGFAIENAELAARRAEQTHVAGCAYRALSCVAQVLFALNGRYLINEKGAVTEAAAYPITIKGLARTQAEIWRDIGNANHESALRRLHGVSDSLRVLVERAGTKGEAGKVSSEQAPRKSPRIRSEQTKGRRSMDAIAFLRGEDKTLEKLFREFEEGRDVGELMGLLDREVSSHALIEEQVLYPAVRARAEAFEDDVIETLEEHQFTEGLLKELWNTPTGAEHFEAKMKVLMEHVRTHVTEQESSLFPRVYTAFSSSELKDLAKELMEAKRAYLR